MNFPLNQNEEFSSSIGDKSIHKNKLFNNLIQISQGKVFNNSKISSKININSRKYKMLSDIFMKSNSIQIQNEIKPKSIDRQKYKKSLNSFEKLNTIDPKLALKYRSIFGINNNEKFTPEPLLLELINKKRIKNNNKRYINSSPFICKKRNKIIQNSYNESINQKMPVSNMIPIITSTIKVFLKKELPSIKKFNERKTKFLSNHNNLALKGTPAMRNKKHPIVHQVRNILSKIIVNDTAFMITISKKKANQKLFNTIEPKKMIYEKVNNKNIDSDDEFTIHDVLKRNQ